MAALPRAALVAVPAAVAAGVGSCLFRSAGARVAPRARCAGHVHCRRAARREFGSDLDIVGAVTEFEEIWSDCCHTARLRACGLFSKRQGAIARGLHIITGGLGGLGLHAAALLVESGLSGIVLASRSGIMPREGHVLAARGRACQCAGRRRRRAAGPPERERLRA
eukprot:2242556-Prymnesium_polylepis.1